MKRLFRILTGLEKEPGFVGYPRYPNLVELITEIKKHIGFSIEKINGMITIRLENEGLGSIIQGYFGVKLSVNSVVSIYSILS